MILALASTDQLASATGTAPIQTLSMEMVDSLEAYFPAGSPVVHLLKAPAAFLETEGAHLKDGGIFKEGSEVIGVKAFITHPLVLQSHDQLGTISQWH